MTSPGLADARPCGCRILWEVAVGVSHPAVGEYGFTPPTGRIHYCATHGAAERLADALDRHVNIRDGARLLDDDIREARALLKEIGR